MSVVFKSLSFAVDEEQDVQPELMFEAYQFNERSTHVKVVCWNLTLTLLWNLKHFLLISLRNLHVSEEKFKHHPVGKKQLLYSLSHPLVSACSVYISLHTLLTYRTCILLSLNLWSRFFISLYAIQARLYTYVIPDAIIIT